MKTPKILDVLSEKQLNTFIEVFTGNKLSDYKLTEIKDEANGLFGDFIIVTNGKVMAYLFKKVYSEYQCLQTPTEKYERAKVRFVKAPNDHYKK